MEEAINLDNEIIPEYARNIKGWGVDADRKNNPTYPIKNYTGADHQRLNYERAVQQPLDTEVLHSNERPGVTRVFGTSLPPRGLSGILRRFAFKYSEGTSTHWLTLLLADRIDMFEGFAEDIRHGYIPNIPRERGWNAEWKYNRPAVVKKAVIGVAIAATVVLLIARKKRRRTISRVDLPYH